MAWLSGLVWAAVSLYGSCLIGRELLAVLRRKESLGAFQARRASLRFRVQLAGIWAVSSAAWTLLLAVTPRAVLLPLP